MPSLLDDPEAYAFANLDEDRRRKLTNQQALNAILQGVGDLPYTLLGAPVEISTGLLRAGGMAQGEQVGGIDYIKRKATELGIRPPDSSDPTMRDMRMAAEIVSGAIDPTRVARAGGAVAGAVAREAKPIIGDALESYMAKSGLAPRMTVFHGSPYKFSAFDPTKIGSGEGAQAYGYGHYVAESPEVAKQYQPRDLNFEESILKKYQQAEKSGDYASMQIYEDFLIHKSPDEIAETIAEAGFTGKDLTNAQNALKQATKLYQSQGQSALYKIDLPDEQIDKMLDWDVEISKQTSEIQKLAKQYGLNMDDLGGDLVAAMNAKLPEGAEAMRSAGVPGIRYYDAQSRGGKQADTRNFVVFPKNEGLLNILERNNEPIAQGGLLSAVPTNDVADTLIYHGTTPSAAKAIEKSGFDVSKSADGTIWFTSNPNIGEVAASGKGAVVNRKLNESNLKLAGWDEIDKYSVDELVNMGYDGVKMPDGNQTTYQIFNLEKLKK